MRNLVHRSGAPAAADLGVALALRDEVADPEAAGAAVIQVDEPALREALPLRRSGRPAYLDWATEAFRLTTCGVRADPQVHTRMGYAGFGGILRAIEELDADVISLEAARELADAGHLAEVGPGVWDIHSPQQAERRGSARPAAGRAGGDPRRPPVGQPGLRPEDP